MGRAGRKNRRRLNRLWLKYEYKHTTIAIAAILAFVLLFDTAFMSSIFMFLRQQAYVGAFVAGMLSASFFTAAPAAVLTVELATSPLDPWLLASFAGLGNAVGDMVLLLFFEERIFHELRPIFRKFKFKFAMHRRKRRSLPLFLIGALAIMTPLPDEAGLGLLGVSRFPRVAIFVICLALNTLGAVAIVLVARAING